MAGKDKKRLIILDTHAILHRAYHALPDFSSSKGVPTGALYGLISILVKVIKDLGPDYIVAAVDLPGATFREAAYADYKGTRAKTDDALVEQIKATPDVLRALGVPVYSAESFEADDIIGTIVEETKKKKDLEIIIATGDADALQLVQGDRVRVFTMRKGITDTVMYDEDAVKERYGFGPESVPDLKGIAGDPSDNIKGIVGVGQGSALKLLQKYQDLKGIYAAIKKEGVEGVSTETGVQKRFVQLVADNKKDAEFSKLLATIRRDAPIDFALPDGTWKERADAKKALDMLAEYEFRGLVPRIREMLGVSAPAEGEMSSDISGTPTPSAETLVPPEELSKATLAVWVLDSSVTNPSFDDVLRIGKSDNFDEAYKNILAEIDKNGLGTVLHKIEEPLMPVLRRMESRGIVVDKTYLEDLSKEYHKELDAIAKRVYKAAGEEFNIGSPKQLGDILFDKLGLEAEKQKKTATGQRSTRESELEKLRDQHPIVGDVLAYRELSKLLGTYIDTIPELLDKESRLHTTFIQTGTSTGRLGSENPNVQNIPIKSESGRRIRNAFVASEGHELVAFDYSQVELRVAAIMSGDEELADIFRHGRDVHAEVAARVFGKDSGIDAYEQRRRAKVINFGILYGMGVNALMQTLGTNRKEAQEFYNQYFAAFPRLAEYLEEVKADASRKGYVETFFGRRRYVEGIKSSIPYVRAAAERFAINAPMQGTSADIIKLAMVNIDKFFEETGRHGHLLLQVHDELVFEIEKKYVKEYAPKLKEMMEQVIDEKGRRGIPLTAEGEIGQNWGEMKELE